MQIAFFSLVVLARFLVVVPSEVFVPKIITPHIILPGAWMRLLYPCSIFFTLLMQHLILTSGSFYYKPLLF